MRESQDGDHQERTGGGVTRCGCLVPPAERGEKPDGEHCASHPSCPRTIDGHREEREAERRRDDDGDLPSDAAGDTVMLGEGQRGEQAALDTGKPKIGGRPPMMMVAKTIDVRISGVASRSRRSGVVRVQASPRSVSRGRRSPVDDRIVHEGAIAIAMPPSVMVLMDEPNARRTSTAAEVTAASRSG